MKTRITELLGIKYPIIQTGMAQVATSALVSATCNAGGLGILGSGMSTEELRQQIRETKERVSGKLFGVNIVSISPTWKGCLQVMMEEQVPVWCSGVRDLFSIAGIKKPENIIYIPTVGHARQAVRLEKAGADAVIVQGWEAGGHGSRIASTVLIPEAVEAVSIPVIAAGGFCDGKGLAAALALGAEGIGMGTRFAISQESPLPQNLKLKYLEAMDRDAVLSTVWDGIPLRVVRGEKMKRYRGWWTHFWDLLPNFLATKRKYNASFGDLLALAKFFRRMHASPFQFLVGIEKARRTMETGDINRGFSAAGQIVGRIVDIPTCHELIERTVMEAEQIIRNLNGTLGDGFKDEQSTPMSGYWGSTEGQ